MPTATLRPHHPAHLSHSQATTVWKCGKAYELERLSGMRALPAWWFIGGRLVHEETELVDRLLYSGAKVEMVSTKANVVDHLDQMVIEEQVKTGISVDDWLAAGRWPKKSGYDWWQENAPLMVERYYEWRLQTDWEVADFNGIPGIECELNVNFDFGAFVGAPDRVFRLPSGQLVVADVKSGTTAPKEPLQLGTYANALEMLGFERPAFGTYVMVKWADKEEIHTPLVPLDKYTTPYLEGVYGSALAQIEVGAFAPVPGEQCRQCVVQRGCYAADGADSQRYDRLHPGYVGS